MRGSRGNSACRVCAWAETWWSKCVVGERERKREQQRERESVCAGGEIVLIGLFLETTNVLIMCSVPEQQGCTF